jgi:hypothetical protein
MPDANQTHNAVFRLILIRIMFVDFEVTHCSRQCAASGRTLAPGETYFSTLHIEEGRSVRRDCSAEEWRGAPEGAIAWWKAVVPRGDGSKPKLAPQDVLLNLFTELAEQPDEADFRYVLGLLLMRRKILKLDETRRDSLGEILVLECPRRGEQYELRATTPDPMQTEQLQQRMIELLYGGE